MKDTSIKWQPVPIEPKYDRGRRILVARNPAPRGTHLIRHVSAKHREFSKTFFVQDRKDLLEALEQIVPRGAGLLWSLYRTCSSLLRDTLPPEEDRRVRAMQTAGRRSLTPQQQQCLDLLVRAEQRGVIEHAPEYKGRFQYKAGPNYDSYFLKKPRDKAELYDALSVLNSK